MNIAFIGLGKFGQAIASLVEYNGLEYDYAEIDKLLAKPADLVFLMVPTQFMRQALIDNRQFIGDEAIIVNGTKGIEEKSHLMAHQIARSVSRYPKYYSLIGPSFAQGVIDQEPTLVSLGYKNPDHIETIKQVLQTPYFRIRESKGYRSLELASALKNLYAILCGYAHGLGFGPNTQAQLMTLALNEFRQLAKAMKFADYDVLSPGVVGDLFLTCSSEQSRNYQYGLALARTGNQDLRETPKSTVEGFHTSHSINAIARQHSVKLPLAALTSRIINKEVASADAFCKILLTYNQ
jgi:glycerol-3-phosphate dehydrogenase (NAD(P)+)